MAVDAHEVKHAWPAPVWVVIAALLALGVVLRLLYFDFPQNFLFDEHHFVENARNYLRHQPDWNDHPPLGKLFIAASIRAFGDTAWAWRLPALIGGFITIALGGLTTRRLFDSRLAGWLAAALLSSDGFLIAYSRAGLLDGYLTAMLVAAFALTTLRWNVRVALAAGVLLGCAVNVKFSGVGLAVPLGLSLVLARLSWRRTLALAAVIATVSILVYLSIYSWGLSLAGQPTGFIAALKDTQRLLDHHAALTDMKNPFVSGWSTWFLPRRAIVMSGVQTLGESRVLTMLGNLAIWWAAVACFGAVVVTLLRRGVDDALTQTPSERDGSFTRFIVGKGNPVMVVLGGALGFLTPWVLTHRDSYLYHFLPTYAALVMLLAAVIEGWVRPRWPRLVMVYGALVLVVASFYAPVWCSMPMSTNAVNTRLFLEGWR